MAFVSACTTAPPEDVDRREALIAAVGDAAQGDTVDLVAVLGDDWDRVAFLHPYYSNKLARETLGFDFDVESESPWTYTEGGTVVVLAADDELVAWLAVPSGDVQLGCLDGRVIPAVEAVFTIREKEGRWGDLGPPDLRFC